MDAFDDRWAFLRPWCAPLRERLVLERTARLVDDSADELVLLVKMPKTKQEARPALIRAIRASLLLLALVDRVDHFAWARVLFSHCGARLIRNHSRIRPQDLETARLELSVALDTVEDDWQVEMLSQFFFAAPELPPTGAFLVTARKILSCGLIDPAVCIPVGVSAFADLDEEVFGFDGLLTRFYQALQRIHCDRTIDRSVRFAVGATAFACEFRLGPVRIEPQAFWSASQVRVTADFITIGRGLPVLSLGTHLHAYYEDDAAESSQIIGQLCERTLRASGCATRDLATVGAVELRTLDANRVERVCSAIAETRTTDELSVSIYRWEMMPAMQQRVWKCLAYALLSKRALARSSIRSVCINRAFMSVEDAEEIAAVLAAHEPAKYLFGQNVDSDEDSGLYCPENAVIREGTLVTMQMMNPEESIRPRSAPWKLENDVTGVQVLEERSAFIGDDVVRVLIPGYGVCEVARGDVIPANNETATHGVTRGVTSLKLSCSGDDDTAAAGLPRFIELVGASLTLLHLDMRSNKPLLLGNVLASRPNLTSLAIGIRTKVSSESFLQGYRANNTRITALDCYFDDLPAVAQEIADATTPLAQSLERLKLYPADFGEGVRATHVEELVGVSSVLDRNRSLRVVEFITHRELKLISQDIVDRFHGEILPIASGALPLQSRLAFLSVLRCNDLCKDAKRAKYGGAERQPASQLPALDQHTAALIFGFAAECVRRRVFMSVV